MILLTVIIGDDPVTAILDDADNSGAAGRGRAGGGLNRLAAERLSKLHWVQGWTWDAVSAFANTGYAVAYVRGSYVQEETFVTKVETRAM